MKKLNDFQIESPLIAERQNSVIQHFLSFETWESRYEEIIRLGKTLKPIADELKTDELKLKGCQSQVWLFAELKEGRIQFQVDSDALIVRGLVGLFVAIYSNQTPDNILSTPPIFLKELGLDAHLSQTRVNGLASMWRQIQFYALAFKTQQSMGR